MTITRTFCSASLLVVAAAITGPVAPGYATEPCCDWVYGKYINLKTGSGRLVQEARRGDLWEGGGP
jgi:hypothetical protein